MGAASLPSQVQSYLAPARWQADSKPEQHSHLYGLRAILTFLGLLWVFFETFIPTVVSNNTDGPTHQKVVRYIFSPLLWDISLITSFFFVLSGRAICIRFLKDSSPSTYAGTIIRRLIRLPIVLTIACAIAFGILGGTGVSYIARFKEVLPNDSIAVPDLPDRALTGLNSMFDLFWVVRNYYDQAANDFWPTHTLWNLSLIYQQSWTIYFLMVILPFTRATWHWPFLGLFALGSFWMNTWGWYDAFALLVADYAINPTLRPRFEQGLEVKQDWHIHWAAIGGIMTVAGTAMKYVWTALPQYVDKELVLHPWVDLTENSSLREIADADPYPRVDNFLVIFGILLIVETIPVIQKLLSARWLVEIGKRSLSLFIAQSIIFWTAGIKMYLHLSDSGTDKALANFAVFVVATVTTVVFGEVYYRVIDLPSQWLANKGYEWLLT
ncbi:hypothetical protein MBLNU230_g6659t1 [Neophaeotheca triangularis]